MKSTEISVLTENSNDSENIRKIKALYQALKTRDKKSLQKILVDKPIWDVSPGFPDGGVYCGMSEIFEGFYQKLRTRVISFGAFPDRFIDGGDTVVALGHYQITKNENTAPILVRFAHAWRIDDEGHVKGVWQVADSASFFAS